MVFTVKKIMVYVLSIYTVIITAGCGNEFDDFEELEGRNFTNESSVIVGQVNWNEITDFQMNHPVRKNAAFVGFVELPVKNSNSYSACTGFMVSPTIMMTNEHCVQGNTDLSKVSIILNYENGVSSPQHKAISCPQLLSKDKDLDYALFRCHNPNITRGNSYAKLEKINPFQIPEGKDIYVVHQNCDYERSSSCQTNKKFSPGKVVQKKYNCQSDKGYICMTADTLRGSSGAPVFNHATHKVIALNNFAWGEDHEQRGPFNSGVSIFNILNFLQRRSPAVYNELMRFQDNSGGVNDSGNNGSSNSESESDHLEPNNNDNQATRAGNFYNGVDLTLNQRDRDLFRIDLPESGRIKVHFGKRANDRINVKIRKGNHIVSQSQVAGQTTVITSNIVAAGSYMLELSTTSVSSIRYSLSLRSTREYLNGHNPDVDQGVHNPDVDQTLVSSFIGGPCESNQQCTYDGGVCLTDQPEGRCSMLCTEQCAYKPGTIPALCVARRYLNESLIQKVRNLSDSNGNSESLCYSQCDRRRFPNTGCEEGASCQELVSQIRNPGTKRNVCFPD